MAGNGRGLGSLVPGGAEAAGAAWGQGRDVAALLRPTNCTVRRMEFETWSF